MTKLQLKQIIKECIKEVSVTEAYENQPIADPRNTAPSELSRFKSVCEALSKKISDALIGQPMTGELIKGSPYSHSAKRKNIQTKVKSVNVDIAYRLENGKSEFHVYVYANGEQGQAGQMMFNGYV